VYSRIASSSESVRTRDLHRWLTQAYVVVRFSALGFTLLLPLLGAASAAISPAWSEIVSLLLIGLAFHVFAYVFNDVMDLRVDRTEPLRADSLLVQGKMTRSQGLWLAWLQLPVAFVLALIGELPAPALAMLSVAFLSMTIYNVYGKRCRVPLLTDAVQAAGWCSLVMVGAMLRQDTVIDAGTIWLLAYLFTYVLLVNGIHGGLRDLRNDIDCGARTTAIWLGAQPKGPSAVLFSARLITYAVFLQAGLGLFVALALASFDYTAGQLLVAGALASLLLLVSIGALFVALTRGEDRRDLVAVGAFHIVATLAVLPTLYLPRLNVTTAALMFLCFTVPVAAMYCYNGRRWCL